MSTPPATSTIVSKIMIIVVLTAVLALNGYMCWEFLKYKNSTSDTFKMSQGHAIDIEQLKQEIQALRTTIDRRGRDMEAQQTHIDKQDNRLIQLQQSIDQTTNVSKQALDKISKTVGQLKEAFDGINLSELESNVNALKDDQDAVTSAVNEMQKGLRLNQNTIKALQKKLDVDTFALRSSIEQINQNASSNQAAIEDMPRKKMISTELLKRVDKP